MAAKDIVTLLVLNYKSPWWIIFNFYKTGKFEAEERGSDTRSKSLKDKKEKL